MQKLFSFAASLAAVTNALSLKQNDADIPDHVDLPDHVDNVGENEIIFDLQENRPHNENKRTTLAEM